MEQETKHKTKKAMAIAGIATLSAFALIGLFAIGALIGGCAEKKQADAPASEQVQTAQARRRAGADEAPNLLENATWYHFAFGWETSTTFEVRSNWSVDCAFITLPRGYYYGKALHSLTACGNITSEFKEYSIEASELDITNTLPISAKPTTLASENVFGEEVSILFAVETEAEFLIQGRYGVEVYLVDSLSVPPSAVVTLPEDWNPTAWVTDEAIGGYSVVHGSYTTEANASGAYVRVGWSNVVFKTASDSAVFSSLVVRYRWLWNGQKYRINDQTLTYSYSSEMALLYPVSVSYLDPMTNAWTIVAKEAQDVIGGEYVHTGKLNWLYPTYRTLGFLKYPAHPTSPTIRFYHNGEAGSGEATWQPTPTLQGLSFFDWFGLASWNSPQHVDVGTGNAIGLISTAFSGMVPILGISIFPNITLGLLLFLPLIGGIIVLIIKAVSK